MGIGICCQWLAPKTKKKRDGTTVVEYLNLVEEKALQLGRFESGAYTNEQIASTYANNIDEVSKILDTIATSSSVRHFRISSNLFPLMDKVSRDLWDNSDIRSCLAALGAKIRRLGFRVSTHPGQFTVLSSDTESVVESSLKEIENHNWVFDSMELDSSAQYPINVHGGKSNRAEKLADSILRLSAAARNRLTLENDESAYSVKELLPVSKKTGVPIVFDSHHHTFREDGLSGAEAAEEAMNTWAPWIIPIQHLSNTEPEHQNGSFADRRKHSFALHYIPDYQLKMLNSGLVDIEMEFKGKNLGVLPYLEGTGIRV
jgi:UV DNA damage endonuclease